MEIFNCRICNNDNLIEVVDMGDQIITSRFPKYGDFSTPSVLIRLVKCGNCNLVQLKETTNSSEIYEQTYGYRSGLNELMRNHLREYNEQIRNFIELGSDDYVLDIGSNDATFLNYYPKYVNKIGCDPTGKQFKEFYDGIELISDYFSSEKINRKVKVVSSISMFYDLPDPVKFAKDVYDTLEDDGIWTLEQSYVATMLSRNSIDTICHEHLEYYGVKQIKEIMDRVNFKIIHIIHYKIRMHIHQ